MTYKVTASHDEYGTLSFSIHVPSENHAYGEALRQLDNLSNGKGLSFKLKIEKGDN